MSLADLASAVGVAGGLYSLTRPAPRVGQFGAIAPTNISTPAYSFGIPGNLLPTSASARATVGPGLTARIPAIGGIADRFAGLAERAGRFAPEIGQLSSDVSGLQNRAKALGISEEETFGRIGSAIAPGFGALTRSIEDTYRNRADEAVGNLRESLSRRGLLGSSFGQDAESRVRLSFAEEEAKAKSAANIQEIGLSLETEQGRGAAARSLLDIDSRLVSQKAGLIAASLGLDEFASSQLTKQLGAIRQAHDQSIDAIRIDLAELGVANGIITNLSDVSSRNAIADLHAAILNAQAQGRTLAGLTGSGLGFNAAGQLVSMPSALERLGGLADRIFGGGVNNIAIRTGYNPALPISATNLPPELSTLIPGYNPALPISATNLPPELSTLIPGYNPALPISATNLPPELSTLIPGYEGMGLGAPLESTAGLGDIFAPEAADTLAGGGLGDIFGGAGGLLEGGIGSLLGPAAFLSLPLILGSLFGGRRNKALDERQGRQQAADILSLVEGGATDLATLNQAATGANKTGAVSLDAIVNNALPRLLDGIRGAPPIIPPGHPLRARLEALREEAKTALEDAQGRRQLFYEQGRGSLV